MGTQSGRRVISGRAIERRSISGNRVVGHDRGPYRGGVHEVVLLIAHGSRNPAAAADHARLCGEVAARSGNDVRPAYLEISEPSIPAAIDAAVAAGATTVRLLPYFLHVGNHVALDLPEIVAAGRLRHPGSTVVLEPHVGAHPGLIDMVAGLVAGPDEHT